MSWRGENIARLKKKISAHGMRTGGINHRRNNGGSSCVAGGIIIKRMTLLA